MGKLRDPTTCLPRKDGGITLGAFFRNTINKLPDIFFMLSLSWWTSRGDAAYTIFWSRRFDATRELNPGPKLQSKRSNHLHRYTAQGEVVSLVSSAISKK